MKKINRKYTPSEKANIALEALKGELTQSQLSSKYQVSSSQIKVWKRQLKEHIVDIFRDTKNPKVAEQAALIEELYQKIGHLQMDLEWLKKKSELFS